MRTFENKQEADAGGAVEKTEDTKKKTTPDEGKTFEKDTVFVCVQDCYQQGLRYRQGMEVTRKKCPAHFVVKQPSEETKE